MHTLQINIDKLPKPVNYKSSIMLIGSCFANNMAERLRQHKFDVLSNPHGTLFNPYSVANSLDSYVIGKQYVKQDLFYLNEIWNSWEHHSDYSDIDKHVALETINATQTEAHKFIESATHVIITLGSAYCYRHKELDITVSNNHRAPAAWFEKCLLSVDEIVNKLQNTLNKISTSNPEVQFLFTVSPVRHVRDGVVENNRSKARLLEAVHTLCEREDSYYFPSYELVIDILRDHRYYDIDLVHPNYLATDYVWERFTQACMNDETRDLLRILKEISIAKKHRPRFPQTEAHKKFKESYAQKIRALSEQHPYLQLNEELTYFTSN